MDRLRDSDLLAQLSGPIFLSTAMACDTIHQATA
jgi:SulP family sulfate permease